MLPTTTCAVSNSFTVQTYIGNDTTPPSAPTSLTAIPIAISQINLAWGSSTDDSGIVAGYHIWRDDVRIGTTTFPAYSDTGLFSSTTYIYYITAFDVAFNESASSTSVATTTLSPIPVTVEDDDEESRQYGSKAVPFNELIASLQIFPQKDSVLIRYVTRKHVRTVVQWGTGASYEIGSLAEQSLTLNHEAYIIGLAPDTSYSFVIDGEDGIGRNGRLYAGEFTTLPPDDIYAPENVSGLRADVIDNDIILSWTNPEDRDFSRVRIMRSTLFYPNDIADGWLIYEGEGNTVRDRGAVDGNDKFYTVFSYDENGNISSGAVVAIRLGTSTSEIVDPTINPISLVFDDVSVYQEGILLPHQDGRTVRIDGSRQITISIPYKKLPEHLKTILVRIGDSRDHNKTFEFLLRVDRVRKFYTGTVAPFGIAGEFPVSVSVFDFETTQVGYTQGVLNAHIRPTPIDSDTVRGGLLSYLSEFGMSYVVWLLLLLSILFLMSRRLQAGGSK